MSSSKPLDLIYSDVWGPTITSSDGYRYYVIFVDHFTRYIWLYPLKNKSDVKDTFILFKNIVEKFFRRSIISLYSDNGGEYIALKSFLQANGISHFTSPPHTPEHNGFAERRHGHIVQTGRTLMHHANLPLKYWSYAFETAVYLINRMPTKTAPHMSPFESLFNKKPNYNRLKIFGCTCYPWLKPYSSSKLDPNSTPCVFLGYSTSKSAYRCLDLSHNKIYFSRHVRFVENKFLFQVPPPQSSSAPAIVDPPGTSPTSLSFSSPSNVSMPPQVPPSIVQPPPSLSASHTPENPSVQTPHVPPSSSPSHSTSP